MAQRRKAKDKEVEAILRDVEAHEDPAFTVEETKSGHFTVRDADGRRVTTFSGTPSDPRSTKNALSPLKRAGYKPRR